MAIFAGVFLTGIAIIVQAAVIVYFFILMNRLLRSVENIEKRTESIEAVIRENGMN